MIFVTYDSMMMVSTRRVCKHPGTRPNPSCSVYVLCLFSYTYKNDVSVLPPNPVWWTNPLIVLHLCLDIYVYYNDDQRQRVSKVRHPYPPFANAGLLVSSVYVWSRSLSFQWPGAAGCSVLCFGYCVVEGSARMCIASKVSCCTRLKGTLK